MHAQPHHPLVRDIKKALFDCWENENKLIDYFCFHFLAYNIIHSSDKHLNAWQSQALLSNKEPHLLQDYLDETFDKNILANIQEKSSVHKLIYKYRTLKKHSFLNYIINEL